MLTVADHPLASHLLAGLRDVDTPPEQFRYLAKRLAAVLVLEATRDLPTRQATVTTPLAPTSVPVLAETIVAVPILRAGLGLRGPRSPPGADGPQDTGRPTSLTWF
jgi:uracil phosphoribosyltransferase